MITIIYIIYYSMSKRDSFFIAKPYDIDKYTQIDYTASAGILELR